jgi:hypothetical protein
MSPRKKKELDVKKILSEIYIEVLDRDYYLRDGCLDNLMRAQLDSKGQRNGKRLYIMIDRRCTQLDSFVAGAKEKEVMYYSGSKDYNKVLGEMSKKIKEKEGIKIDLKEYFKDLKI